MALAMTWILLSTLALGLNYCMAEVSHGKHNIRGQIR